MDKRKIIDRIINLIDENKKQFPNSWKHIGQERFKRLKDIPSHCFCPTSIVRNTIIHKEYRDFCNNMDIDIFTALYSWKATKGIYLFNETLTSNLKKTVIKETFPFNLLYRLPHWSDYVAFEKSISLKDIDDVYQEDSYLVGFFYFIDYDKKRDTNDFIIILDVEIEDKDLLTSLNLSIDEDNNISASIDKGFSDNKAKNMDYAEYVSKMDYSNQGREAHKHLCLIAKYVFPFILYLCSDKPDIIEQKTPAMKKKKKKNISYANKIEPDFYEVGFNIGKQLKLYEQSNNHTGIKMHPHVRSAHWHTYYAGPRSSEEREVRIKWIPNVLVNFNSDSDIKPTIYNT